MAFKCTRNDKAGAASKRLKVEPYLSMPLLGGDEYCYFFIFDKVLLLLILAVFRRFKLRSNYCL